MRGQPIRYRAEELAFVRERQAESRQAIRDAFAAAFGRTEVTADHIKSLCTRMGWTNREAWTEADEATIRDRYADEPTATIAAALGRTSGAVYARAKTLGLTKSATYLATAESGRMQPGDDRGARSRYTKGTTPLNKGKKRPKGWAPGRMLEGQFSAEKPSWNTVPIGTERVKLGYRWTKVADAKRVCWNRNWRQTHVLAWEALHGPLPAGHCLKCLDGNRLNTAPENWECVPRGVLFRLNGGRLKQRIAFDAAPGELKPVLLTVARLEHAAHHRKRTLQAAGA